MNSSAPRDISPDDSDLPVDSDLLDDSDLPVDSDIDDNALGATRPVHLRARYLALVALGGMIGTAAREALSLAIPPVAGVPVTIGAINVVGAFALGLLLEVLGRRGVDAGKRRTVRLFVGTGALGGFTTYSALATDTVHLLNTAPLLGIAYASATLLIGAAASIGGIAVGARLHDHRQASNDTRAVSS